MVARSNEEASGGWGAENSEASSRTEPRGNARSIPVLWGGTLSMSRPARGLILAEARCRKAAAGSKIIASLDLYENHEEPAWVYAVAEPRDLDRQIFWSLLPCM
jgi:hypothetical protein